MIDFLEMCMCVCALAHVCACVYNIYGIYLFKLQDETATFGLWNAMLSLKVPHCVKTCPHAKKKKKYLNSINNKKFILRLNKGLSELITCWETNSFQEVLILEESTELKL